MKKRFAFLIGLFLLVSFSGCGENAETAKLKGGFAVTQKVGDLPSTYTNSIIENELLIKGVKTADGYLVPSTEKTSVAKYDLQGKLIWNQEYEYVLTSENSCTRNSIVPTSDGGFVLGTIVNTYRKPDGTWVRTDPVVAKCNKNGKLLWSKSYKGFSDTTLHKIFCLSNGDIITIGDTETKETKIVGVVSPRDIYISKLNKDGKLIDEKYYGGSDFDILYDAEYIEGVGVVALINTQSVNGTLAAYIDSSPLSVVTLFDLSLQMTWKKNFEGFLPTDCMMVYDNHIYALKSVVEANNWYYSINKMDLNGNILYTKDIEINDSIKFIKGSLKGVLLKYTDKLLLLDADGTEKLEFQFSADDVNKIVEYDDYFLIISTNITGNLPQPPQISMKWHSTELVYSGYDYTGKLLWRQAYDNTPKFMKSYDPEKNTDWLTINDQK